MDEISGVNGRHSDVNVDNKLNLSQGIRYYHQK